MTAIDPILTLSVDTLAERVRAGDVKAEAVAERALAHSEQQASINAFIWQSRERVLEQARALDQRRARGESLGALAGVPVGIKDALCTVDAPTTAGSAILTRRPSEPANPGDNRGWLPPYDATVVRRLRDADAILIGKTNMDEFAMGSSNENSAFGPVKNPWDRQRVPGGSSGGSAACVAARLATAALGSDTGGSIRQPAGLCGVVGVKPSYGRVSRFGLIAFASSLDQVGPIAGDVRGAARVLSVIAGHDPRDSTSAPEPVGDYLAACEQDLRGVRVGVPEEYFGHGLDADVERLVREAIAALEELGASVAPVSLPHTKYGVSSYYLVATAEASSNLARYDGVRYGLRVEPPGGDLKTMYGATRRAGFGTEVKRRIMLGTYALSAGYYDAYYKKAQQVRTLIKRDFARAFEQVDVLAAPVCPTPAYGLGEKISEPLTMYLGDVFTLPASLAGLCGISVPAGTTEKRPDRPALPVGLQLLAPAFAEERLFSVASRYESVSPAQGRLPPL